MNDPIRKGDLCIVVKPLPCCGWPNWLGKPVTAASGPRKAVVLCATCRSANFEEIVDIEGGMAYPRAGLRRIPPLADLETTKTTEGAPA